MAICCQICCSFLCLSISLMISHLVLVHKNDQQINIKCEVPGCQAIFHRIYSYKSHLRRRHKDIDLTANLDLEEHNISQECEIEPMDVEIDTDNSGLYDKLEDREEAYKRQNALYLLKTKETQLLTQRALDEIVDGSTALVRNTVELLHAGVQNRLDSAGIRFDAVPGLSELFEQDHVASNPFQHISTKSQQADFYKKNFDLVEPRRVKLGYRSKQRRSGTKYKEVLVEEEFMYVPLLQTLERLLNKTSILSQVLNGHISDDGKIRDFCDGEMYKNHPLFSTDPTALQLLMYYDEVEVSNPLGSKTGKHKLGVIYFTLGNILPENRSQLNAIQLLAVASSPVIKKYGIDSILEPFMEDLEKLEQDAGYQFLVNGERKSFAGSIAYFSGDNLGSQLIGGFKEGSGAHLKCRQCMGNKDEITTKFLESEFMMRTRGGHDHHCMQIEHNQDMSKIYGVNRKSILCNSRYYHVADGLPGDAMHDILEGLLQYEVKEMLKVFILEEKYFSINQLNERIRKFDFGFYNDKNKPSPISYQTLTSDNNSLKQKAAQMWCLGKFLPLMIGNLVPEDDEKWQLFGTLLEIVDIVFSPVASVDTIGILEGLIEDHHLKFCDVYPGKSVLPKMHYLVHYPSHMFRLGPMVRSWCMRFEAKHRYIKRLAGYIGNFNNVAYTMAERHQRQQCYYMNTDDENTFLMKPTVIGPGKEVVAGDSDYFVPLQQKKGNVHDTDILLEPKKVTIHGTEYRVGAILYTGFADDELPVFSSIKKIIVIDNNEIIFLLAKYVTIEFTVHYHAFHLRREVQPQTFLAYHDDFLTYLPAHIIHPFGIMNKNGSCYVAPRYSIPAV